MSKVIIKESRRRKKISGWLYDGKRNCSFET